MDDLAAGFFSAMIGITECICFSTNLALLMEKSTGQQYLAMPPSEPPISFSRTGCDMQALQANGFDHLAFTPEWSRAPAIIQSFEIENLQWLNSTSGIPLMQLLDEADLSTADNDTPYSSMMTDEGLATIATYAQILGNWKGSPVPPDGSGVIP